jgi:hypothetical protein
MTCRIRPPPAAYETKLQGIPKIEYPKSKKPPYRESYGKGSLELILCLPGKGNPGRLCV